MKSQIVIQENIALAPYTTFKIGGPARFFCVVQDVSEFQAAVEFAHENKLEILVLSGGSNVLISDKGFSGLVIKLEAQGEGGIKLVNDHLECWSGEKLAKLVSFCLEKKLTGMEWAMGIPGTVGGAVRGNAGAYGGTMSNAVEQVFASNKKTNSSSKEFNKPECQFAYRNSFFRENPDWIVLNVNLNLQKGSTEEIRKKMEEIAKKRIASLPRDYSAGSFFKNPLVTDEKILLRFEKDSKAPAREGKIPAGWLIEEAGLRGKKIGQVMISEKHANFIVNTGGGTAEEVVMLASIVKQKVRSMFDVQLKEEIIYVGF